MEGRETRDEKAEVIEEKWSDRRKRGKNGGKEGYEWIKDTKKRDKGNERLRRDGRKWIGKERRERERSRWN